MVTPIRRDRARTSGRRRPRPRRGGSASRRAGRSPPPASSPWSAAPAYAVRAATGGTPPSLAGRAPTPQQPVAVLDRHLDVRQHDIGPAPRAPLERLRTRTMRGRLAPQYAAAPSRPARARRPRRRPRARAGRRARPRTAARAPPGGSGERLGGRLRRWRGRTIRITRARAVRAIGGRDGAAVHLDEVANDREPEAEALVRPGARRVRLAEAVEHVGQERRAGSPARRRGR